MKIKWLTVREENRQAGCVPDKSLPFLKISFPKIFRARSVLFLRSFKCSDYFTGQISFQAHNSEFLSVAKTTEREKQWNIEERRRYCILAMSMVKSLKSDKRVLLFCLNLASHNH